MNKTTQWNIVIVDDEPDNLHLLADLLTYNGADVYSAANGKACLELLKAIIPTAIILDLNMPSPDGWELLSAIRAKPLLSHVPVIAITAYYSERVHEEALRVGFDAFVNKPIKSGDLLDLLDDLIE